MNVSQMRQWDDFACMSEALLVAAVRKNITLTAEDYRAKYERLFPNPEKQYGGLFLSRFHWIARSMGLGQDMDLVWPFNEVKRYFEKQTLVFVFSGIHLDPVRTDDFSHVSLLQYIDEVGFSIEGYHRNFAAGDWVKKRCCGIIVF